MTVDLMVLLFIDRYLLLKQNQPNSNFPFDAVYFDNDVSNYLLQCLLNQGPVVLILFCFKLETFFHLEVMCL